MVEEGKSFNIVDDTEVVFAEEKISEAELKQLQDLGVIISYQANNYQLERIEFNGRQLRELGFEYSILEDVASSIEVDVMRVFRRNDTDRLTTGEISETIDKPTSSVSRALGRLVEKGQIQRIQRGLYSAI